MKKTIDQWLDLITDPIVHKQVVENILQQHGEPKMEETIYAQSLKVVLPRCFNFEDTPEKSEYWINFCKTLD